MHHATADTPPLHHQALRAMHPSERGQWHGPSRKSVSPHAHRLVDHVSRLRLVAAPEKDHGRVGQGNAHVDGFITFPGFLDGLSRDHHGSLRATTKPERSGQNGEGADSFVSEEARLEVTGGAGVLHTGLTMSLRQDLVPSEVIRDATASSPPAPSPKDWPIAAPRLRTAPRLCEPFGIPRFCSRRG